MSIVVREITQLELHVDKIPMLVGNFNVNRDQSN
jgi:hypothetical protein